MTNMERLLRVEIDKLNRLLPGFSFTPQNFRKSSDGSYWARVFILRDGISIGRITYRYITHLETYYYKSYKKNEYPYDSDDDIFFHLRFYLATGKKLSGLDKMIEKAKEERERIFMENMIWRAAHPTQKKRRRLQKKNVRYIVETMVGLEAEKHNRNLLKIK